MENSGFPQGFQGFSFNANEQPIMQQQPVVKTVPTMQAQIVPQQVIAQPVANTGTTTVLTSEQVRMYVDQLKPTIMSNPVKITQPSYLISEEHMKYLLSLAQGNPNSLPSPSAQLVLPSFNTNNAPSRTKNVVDQIGSVTFGTAGRIGHTLTGLVDNVIDIITMGYSKKKV